MLAQSEIIGILRADREGVREVVRYSYNSEPVVIDGYSFKNEETHGGSEGSGEEYWFVFSVSKDGEKTFWKVPGWYQSYHGAEVEWSSVFEVESRPVTRNEWFAK